MNNKRHRFLLFVLCGVLLAAIALMTTGCNKKTPGETESPAPSETQASTDAPGSSGTADRPGNTPPASSNGNATPGGTFPKGEGNTVFYLTVSDLNGKETTFEIRTDKTYVGEALTELGLLDGEPGPYGLYVKTVNDLTLDYDKDGAYWAFYVNGKYAMSGVDTTKITPGASYTLKAEKG